MQYSKWVAIGICIALVLGSYEAWNYSTSAFNPNPSASSLAVSQCSMLQCGRFGILSANLTVINSTEADVLSQYIGLEVLPSGAAPLTELHVYLDNISIGTEPGPFALGKAYEFELGVPTSIVINPGTRYALEVEGVYGTGGDVLVSVGVIAAG